MQVPNYDHSQHFVISHKCKYPITTIESILSSHTNASTQLPNYNHSKYFVISHKCTYPIRAFPMIIISILNRMFRGLLKSLQAEQNVFWNVFLLVISYYLHVFSTIVRPLLEFSSVIWCPYYINEIKKIESVQRTFMKSIGNLRLYTYHERLSILKIDSLQCRRLKTDLIICYKIFYGLIDINSSCFFKRSLYDSTPGNSLKLAKLHVISKCDKNIFTNRVINIWNALPDSIVTSSSVPSFKKKHCKIWFVQISAVLLILCLLYMHYIVYI